MILNAKLKVKFKCCCMKKKKKYFCLVTSTFGPKALSLLEPQRSFPCLNTFRSNPNQLCTLNWKNQAFDGEKKKAKPEVD